MQKVLAAVFFMFCSTHLHAMELENQDKLSGSTINLNNKKETIEKLIDLSEGKIIFLEETQKAYTIKNINYDIWLRKSNVAATPGKILLSNACNLDLSKDDVSPTAEYSYNMGATSRKCNIDKIIFDIVPQFYSATEAQADARQLLRTANEDSCKLKLIMDELCAVGDSPTTKLSGLVKIKLEPISMSPEQRKISNNNNEKVLKD